MKNNPLIQVLLAFCLLLVLPTNGWSTDEKTNTISEEDYSCTLKITATPEGVYCGEYTGSIEVKITGGTAPYKIEWDNSDNSIWAEAHTNSGIYTIKDLPKGTYQIKVTDYKGCYDKVSHVTLDVNASNLTYTLEANDPCASAGSLIIRIANSSPPYWVILKGPTSGAVVVNNSAFRIDNLLPGHYKVIVDKDGCGHEQFTTLITTPTPLSVSIDQEDTNECDAFGDIMLNIHGGTAEYFISWYGATNGNTRSNGSKSIRNLAPGDYTFTVRDANFCTASTTVTVKASGTDLACVLTQTPVICDNMGQIGISIYGGKPTYRVDYSGPVSGYVIASTTGDKSATASLWDLPPGYYNILVTDSRGCTASETITVGGQLTDLACIVTQTPVVCDNMGQIGVAISGGQPAYRVDYSGPVSGSIVATTTGERMATATIWDLPAGTYTIKVTDSRGCVANESITVGGELTDIACVVTQTPVICDNMGNIIVAINGGQPTYRVDYSGPVSGSIIATTTGEKMATATIWDLPAGYYTITVTDSRGCAAVETITVSGTHSDLACVLSVNPLVCASSAGINVDISGGYPNYTVYYSGPVSGTIETSSSVFIPLPLGYYTIVVTDAKGCSVTETAEVGSGVDDLHCRLVQTHLICTKSGFIEVIISGGKPGFSVSWTVGHLSGSATTTGYSYTFEAPCPGTYDITVTDANGCTVMESTTVRQLENNLKFSLIANAGQQEGNGFIEVYFQSGRPFYTIELTGPVTKTTISDGAVVFSYLPSGYYSVFVTDANGCNAQYYITVPTVGVGSGMRISNKVEGGLTNANTSKKLAIGNTNQTVTETPIFGSTNQSSDAFEVYQNHPNPFKSSTTISFNLPKAMKAEITIHNHLGKTINKVEENFSKGYNEYQFNHNNLSSGVFYYTINTGKFNKTTRMLHIE